MNIFTDEDIKEIVGPWGDTPIKGYTRSLFDRIEAKLREKKVSNQVCDHGHLRRSCEICQRDEEIKQLKAERDAAAKDAERSRCAWEEGRAWQSKASGWWSADQDPNTAGLYVVRDSKGNTEVAIWVCDWNGKNGEWTHELRDVNRDDIVAWMNIPEYAAIDAARSE